MQTATAIFEPWSLKIFCHEGVLDDLIASRPRPAFALPLLEAAAPLVEALLFFSCLGFSFLSACFFSCGLALCFSGTVLAAAATNARGVSSSSSDHASLAAIVTPCRVVRLRVDYESKTDNRVLSVYDSGAGASLFF